MTILSTTEAVLLWKLARSHWWSRSVDIDELVRDAPVTDERRARGVAREDLAARAYVVHDPSADAVALDDPPLDQAARDLSEYGYSDLKIRATFGDQQDAV